MAESKHVAKIVICGFALLLLLASVGAVYVEVLLLPPGRAAIFLAAYAIAVIYCAHQLK